MLHYFSIFWRRIKKTSNLSSANFTEGIVQKTYPFDQQKNEIIYSRSACE